MRVLEQQTGLSRGAIFHHFRDKEALFLALAEEDAQATAAVVDEGGLIEAMRRLPERDAGWLGVELEVSRRLRTEPAFRREWQRRLDAIRNSAQHRLAAAQAAGTVRDDIAVDTLVTFLRLVHDGLVVHLAAGTPDADIDAVLDLVERTVRKDPYSDVQREQG
ncbi:MAG: TetR/AcrR family transcriptional regulator, transcriptional repressor of aconitase [Frankiales bacterium]|nr:TetR/AcrR family transcriptional regulator, transcriptional repressor of aconitase [Frankiales bacterium]